MNAVAAFQSFDGVPAASGKDVPANERVFAFLDSQQYVLYHPTLAERLGYKAALFVGHAIYWSRYVMREHPERGGWFYASASAFAKATGLSAHEQRVIRAHLVNERLLDEQLIGHPAQLHYRLDWRGLARSLGDGADSAGDDLAPFLGSGMRVWPALGHAAHSVAAGVYLSLLLHRQRAVAGGSHFRLTQQDVRIALHLGIKVQRNAREALTRRNFYTEDGSGFLCRVNLPVLEAALGLVPAPATRRPSWPSIAPLSASNRTAERPGSPADNPQALLDPSGADAPAIQRTSTAAQLGFGFTNSATQDAAPAGLLSDLTGEIQPVDQEEPGGAVIHKNGCQELALFEHPPCPFYTSTLPFLNIKPALFEHLYKNNKRQKNTTTTRAGAHEAAGGTAKTASRRRSSDQKPKTAANSATGPQPAQVTEAEESVQPPLPQCLSAEWHEGVRRTLEQAPAAIRKALLDELEGQLTLAGKTIHNPAGYLHRLIRLHADGTLQFALASKVASDREQRAKALAVVERAMQAKPVQRETPDATSTAGEPSDAEKHARERLRMLRKQFSKRGATQ